MKIDVSLTSNSRELLKRLNNKLSMVRNEYCFERVEFKVLKVKSLRYDFPNLVII
jgi:hypothetical protein